MTSFLLTISTWISILCNFQKGQISSCSHVLLAQKFFSHKLNAKCILQQIMKEENWTINAQFVRFTLQMKVLSRNMLKGFIKPQRLETFISVPFVQINFWIILLWINMLQGFIKFIYSEKATKFCEIFTLLLTVCTMAVRAAEFSNGGYKIRKVFA